MDVGKTVEDVTKKIRTFVAPVIRNLVFFLELCLKIVSFSTDFVHFDCFEIFLSDFRNTVSHAKMRHF